MRSSGSDGEERGAFAHKPLAGLAALRGHLPDAPSGPASASEAGAPVRGMEASAPRMVVQRERKHRGGKTVTRIRAAGEAAQRARSAVTGPGGMPPEQLARTLARSLGCGASVEDGDVLLQGDQVNRAAEWLERQVARVVRGN